MAEFACVLFVKQKQDLKNMAENSGVSEPKSDRSVSHNVTDALSTLSLAEPRKVDRVDQQEGNDEGTRKINFWSKKFAIIHGLHLTTKMDLVGFIVFHLTYLLFNGIYWPCTLHVSGRHN